MVLISFYFSFPSSFICTNNPVIGRCKVRLLDINMYINTATYSGYLRLDSPDGQLTNNKLPGNTYGGICFAMTGIPGNPPYCNTLINKEDAFEFETDLRTTSLTLNIAQADRIPSQALFTGTDSGWVVFDVTPIKN